MTTITNYGDAEPTAAEQRIAELEQEIEATRATLQRVAADLRRQLAEINEQSWNHANLHLDANAALRRQLAECESATVNVRREWMEDSQRKDRQLAHMTQWRDSAIVDGNEARAEAASLRAAVDTYAADLARVSAERDQLREAAFVPRR